MIEEQFVSFETAKLLKEAGFDVPCRGIYRVYRMGNSVFREYDRKNTKDDLCWNTEDGFQYEYLAPTQALAARWLRESRHYVICAWLAVEEKKWFYAYGDTDDMFLAYDYAISDAVYDTYEEAMEAGLKNCLELIKK